jgi:hypothetical protein
MTGNTMTNTSNNTKGKTMKDERRVESLCRKARDLRDATRIWNAIDNLASPEPLWAVMQSVIPWAFNDPRCPNTMRFTY